MNGRFFEDFRVRETIRHATPRTVTAGDVALYLALTGSRFAVNSSAVFAGALGYSNTPLDDILVFHIVFGKSVPDVSLNAIANLGYANGRFGAPVYPGDTLDATSTVLGKREASNGKAGIVWVRTVGTNQSGEAVLDYIRWVLVNKRDASAPAPEAVVPEVPAIEPESLKVPAGVSAERYDCTAGGDQCRWQNVNAGDRFDHVDGMTIEDAEHQMATRLYQNTARVHFDAQRARSSHFGKRIVYGGHIISLARSLSFNGLANAFCVVGLNGGQHTAPTFGGDTIYAWSEVLEKSTLAIRTDVGALRLRTVAAKNLDCAAFPDRGDDGKHHPNKVLELDYWVLMPR